jgi:hypothetical protein
MTDTNTTSRKMDMTWCQIQWQRNKGNFFSFSFVAVVSQLFVKALRNTFSVSLETISSPQEKHFCARLDVFFLFFRVSLKRTVRQGKYLGSTWTQSSDQKECIVSLRVNNFSNTNAGRDNITISKSEEREFSSKSSSHVLLFLSTEHLLSSLFFPLISYRN